MTSDEDFILCDMSHSAAPLPSYGRADLGRSHSDEAESSQKPYGASEARDEYSEDHDFGLGAAGPAPPEERLPNKGLEGLMMHQQSQNLMMNGARLSGNRRGGTVPPSGGVPVGVVPKRRDREETSDGGTYFKKGKVSDKKDREEWSDGAISCLLDTYTEKFIQLNRGSLRGSDWEEVAQIVSERSDGQKPPKTVDQCKNKVDSLKKRYKTEKSRGSISNNGVTLSYWPWFKKVDQIIGASAKLNVLSDDEKDRVVTGVLSVPQPKTVGAAVPLHSSNVNSVSPLPMHVVAGHRRVQGPIPAALGFLNTPKKIGSGVRWKRVLLKLSGKSLVGTHSVDPEVFASIAREVASVARLGIEVAIVIGGGNIFNGHTWVSSGGPDRTAADHVGMVATVMNSILLQAALESIEVPTRVQTTFKFLEIAEPYNRNKAIRHLEKGRVVIFGAGTGNPYFTTDAAAALRADEINADVLLKATNMDGIYNSDPKHNLEAVVHDHLSYRDAVTKGSTIIDMTAITHCQERAIPVVIFNMHEPGNISKALSGEHIGTLVDQNGPGSLYE